MSNHVCPWWLGYSFDNPLRRLVHDPVRILAGLVEEGQTVADIGCGLGYFSIALASLVGPSGKVIAVDLQPEVLERARKRAVRKDLDGRIDFRSCARDRLGLTEPIDFALAFWMVHEVPDQKAFFAEVAAALGSGGRLLVVEPLLHVPLARFEATTEIAKAAGLDVTPGPAVRISRAITCVRR